jgi:hypothetical protein
MFVLQALLKSFPIKLKETRAKPKTTVLCHTPRFHYLFCAAAVSSFSTKVEESCQINNGRLSTRKKLYISASDM